MLAKGRVYRYLLQTDLTFFRFKGRNGHKSQMNTFHCPRILPRFSSIYTFSPQIPVSRYSPAPTTLLPAFMEEQQWLYWTDPAPKPEAFPNLDPDFESFLHSCSVWVPCLPLSQWFPSCGCASHSSSIRSFPSTASALTVICPGTSHLLQKPCLDFRAR